VTLFAGLHGGVALALLGVLLFAEESGVPLPLAPGDALLIAAGVLIANGGLHPAAFAAVASVAVTAGALVAFFWARLLGTRGLRAVAERLRADAIYEKTAGRLSRAGALGIAVGRLLPGTRVYTAMVAGATGIPLRTFLLGLLPSVAVWLAGFTLLVYLVGVPAERALGHVQQLALNGAVTLAVAVAGYLAARHVPAAQRREVALSAAPRRWRLGIAAVLDLTIVLGAALSVEELARDALGLGEPGGAIDVQILFAAIAVGYLVVTRRGAGVTAGEGLLSVSYRRRPVPHG